MVYTCFKCGTSREFTPSTVRKKVVTPDELITAEGWLTFDLGVSVCIACIPGGRVPVTISTPPGPVKVEPVPRSSRRHLTEKTVLKCVMCAEEQAYFISKSAALRDAVSSGWGFRRRKLYCRKCKKTVKNGHQALVQRDAAMVEMRRAGVILEEIGSKFSVTRERARQVLKREGVQAPTKPKQSKENDGSGWKKVLIERKKELDQRNTTIISSRKSGASIEELMKRFNLGKVHMYRILAGWEPSKGSGSVSGQQA